MSNLINKTRLQKFATDLWAKIKGRYDGTFKEAEISASTETEKKITLTKVDNTTKEISLADYARLQDRNAFKKDVSVDDAKIVSNKNIGVLNGPVTAGNRTTGYRGLTSGLFTDGYVKLLRIHLPQDASGNVRAHVWAVKKGTSKTEDKYVRKIVKAVPVQTAGTNKYIDETRPWELEKNDEKDKLQSSIYHLIENIRKIGIIILPIMQETAEDLLSQIGIPQELQTWDSLKEYII